MDLKGFFAWIGNRGLILSYALLVFLIAAGFFRFEMLADDVARESARTAFALCRQNNDTQALTLEILEVTDPALVDHFRGRLQPVDCPPDPDVPLPPGAKPGDTTFRQ